MKRLFALILIGLTIGNLYFASFSFADDFSISIGMNKEEVKTIIGKPDDEYKNNFALEADVWSFSSVSFSEFNNAYLFCTFVNDILIEATYIHPSETISKDISHLTKSFEMKFGKECTDEAEIKQCLTLMDYMGPANTTHTNFHIWKNGIIYIILSHQSTSGGGEQGYTRVVHMLDLVAIANNTNGQ